MLTLNKVEILRDSIALSKNRGFAKQLKEDDSLLLKYAIKKNLIKVPKAFGETYINNILPEEERKEWLNHLSWCDENLSAKILFMIYNAGKINLVHEKVPRRRRGPQKIERHKKTRR